MHSWKLSRLLSLGILLAIGLVPCRAQAGMLDRAGSEARRGSARSGSSSSSSSSYKSSSSSGSSEPSSIDPALAELLAVASFYAVTSPWWVPNTALESKRAPGAESDVRFASYPYADGHEGHLLEPVASTLPSEDSEETQQAGPEQPSKQKPAHPRGGPVAAVLGAEAGMGPSDGIIRLGLAGRVMFPTRFDLTTEWSQFRERNAQGEDRMLLGRELVSIRFAESKQLVFRSGLGLQHLVDQRGAEHGVDFTWGFEAFPIKPLVFSLEGDIGSVGRSLTLGARGRLGVMIGRMEVSLGYHQRSIGSVALGGPYFGLSTWF